MQLAIKVPEGENGTEEWAIIEMQGDLESRVGDTDLTGKFIGDLHYSKDSSAPILIIGHHILHGKVQSLDRPFVAMEKCLVAEDNMDVDGQSRPQSYQVKAIIKKKLIFKTRPKPIIANVPKKV